MTQLLKKLNYKENKNILVLNAPASFNEELNNMRAFANVVYDENMIAKIDFAIIFVTKQAEVNACIDKLYPKVQGDVVLWFCYPKGTSKKYKCDFNRDTGWSQIRKYGMDTVRQVAIDEDWSALRFRKNEFIKTTK